MSNVTLQSVLQQNNAERNEYKEKKQAERDELFSKVNAFVGQLPGDPAKFTAYLNMQAVTPTSGMYKTILILDAMPGAVDIRTAEAWSSAGRKIRAGVHGIRTLERDSYTKNEVITGSDAYGNKQTYNIAQQKNGYVVGYVFDATQTIGAPLPPAFSLKSDEEISGAFGELVSVAGRKYGAKVYTLKDQDAPVYYGPEQKAIVVREKMKAADTFAALTCGIVQADCHSRNGGMPYDPQEHDFECMGAAYVICRSFGVEIGLFDLAALHSKLSGLDEKGVKGCMNAISRASNYAGYQIESRLSPERKHSRYNYHNNKAKQVQARIHNK